MASGIYVENTFAGCEILTYDNGLSDSTIDKITLPSGYKIYATPNWDADRWDKQIAGTKDPADIAALSDLKASWSQLAPQYTSELAQKKIDNGINPTTGLAQTTTPVPTNTTQQNDSNLANGQADGDSGSDSSKNTNDGTPDSQGATSPTYFNVSQNNIQPPANSGSTVSGSAGLSLPPGSGSRPGKRMQNPLGDFASYTYQISLYMVTPDAYNAFIESGRKNINAIATVGSSSAAANYNDSAAGVYLIAQSGGINNTTSMRAPGFDLDYYIDNLEISAAISGAKSDTGSGGPTNEVEIKFQIIEPYGFSLITNLKEAQDRLQEYSQILKKISKENLPTADRTDYILGIRFLGYDINGNVISGLERLGGSTQVDPTSTDTSGSFETFYDIKLKEMSFKIDGRATVYNCSAVSTPTLVGMGLKCGRLTSDTTITGRTVGEALANLETQLNNQQRDLKVDIPNQYEILYIGDDADLIENASIVSKADTDKSKLPMLMEAINNKSITVKDEIKAESDVNQRSITFKGSGGATSIVQVIQQVVTQSSYIQDALKFLYTTDTTPDENTDDYQEEKPNSNKTLKWINVSTEIINLGYDETKNDFSYKIRYLVRTYETPIVTAVSAGLTTPYYGPHKRYEYWFTGKNSEILRYEMTYNQLYLNVAVKGIEKDDKSSTGGVPVGVGMRASAPRQGKLGIGAEAQNAYVSYLSDEAAYAEAHVTILGDPDFLVNDNSSSLNAVYDKFYGSNGYSVSGNGGQVFIEIDFKEAVDYDTSRGVMAVNNKILFIDYPDEVKKYIKGVSYQVTDVKSTFKSGKFEQQLKLIVNPIKKDPSKDPRNNQSDAETARLNRQAQAGGTSNQTNPKNTPSIGFTKAEPVTVVDSSASSPSPSVGNGDTNLAGWYDYEGESTSPTGGPSSTAGILAASASKPIQDDDATNAVANNLIKPAEITIPETQVREETTTSTTNTGLRIWTA